MCVRVGRGRRVGSGGGEAQHRRAKREERGGEDTESQGAASVSGISFAIWRSVSGIRGRGSRIIGNRPGSGVEGRGAGMLTVGGVWGADRGGRAAASAGDIQGRDHRPRARPLAPAWSRHACSYWSRHECTYGQLGHVTHAPAGHVTHAPTGQLTSRTTCSELPAHCFPYAV